MVLDENKFQADVFVLTAIPVLLRLMIILNSNWLIVRWKAMQPQFLLMDKRAVAKPTREVEVITLKEWLELKKDWARKSTSETILMA